MKNQQNHNQPQNSPENLQLLDRCGLEMLRELKREQAIEGLKQQRQNLKG
jgi:hypothetical protein